VASSKNTCYCPPPKPLPSYPPAAMALAAVSDLYTRARLVSNASQASIDSLMSFMSARAALEDSYAKSLAKLSRSALVVDGMLLAHGESWQWVWRRRIQR